MTKTKSTKIFISFMLITVLAFSMVIPAHAANATWTSRIEAFPMISQATNRAALVAIVQKTCHSYSAENRIAIDNNGGVDGQFGGATLFALKNFQAGENLSPDGVAGSKTWGAIADVVNQQYASNTVTHFKSVAPCAYTNEGVFRATLANGSYTYEAFETDGISNCNLTYTP